MTNRSRKMPSEIRKAWEAGRRDDISSLSTQTPVAAYIVGINVQMSHESVGGCKAGSSACAVDAHPHPRSLGDVYRSIVVHHEHPCNAAASYITSHPRCHVALAVRFDRHPGVVYQLDCYAASVSTIRPRTIQRGTEYVRHLSWMTHNELGALWMGMLALHTKGVPFNRAGMLACRSYRRFYGIFGVPEHLMPSTIDGGDTDGTVETTPAPVLASTSTPAVPPASDASRRYAPLGSHGGQQQKQNKTPPRIPPRLFCSQSVVHLLHTCAVQCPASESDVLFTMAANDDNLSTVAHAATPESVERLVDRMVSLYNTRVGDTLGVRFVSCAGGHPTKSSHLQPMPLAISRFARFQPNGPT